MARGQFRSRPNGRPNAANLPLTHFLSLPIGHHEQLRKTLSSFTNGLLERRPMLPGLDPTIVISPRRLHLTLGVMSLDPDDAQSVNSNKTLSDALSLLSSLRPQVLELLRGARLNVPLQIMDIMPPEDDDLDKAHVLWCGPSPDNEDAQRLRVVSELVNKTFVKAGFINDRRPLKLHCTILNTTHRRPKTRGRREAFSYRSILASPVGQARLSGVDSGRQVMADFGTWHVNEIQICKMGSYGPEGEYESCGGIVLN